MTVDAADVLRRRFTEEGLPFPDLPLMTAQQRLVSDWHLTTRTVAPPPYFIEEYVTEFVSGDPDDYVVLAHAGHGSDSWAISYLVVAGPVGVFVQSTWGGASTGPADQEQEVARLAERFRATDQLLAAPRQRLAEGERLAVVDSDFRNRGWAVIRPGEEPNWRRSGEPLREARDHLS